MEKFNELYAQVFNEDNTVKLCGRYKCMELIELAKTIEPNTNFGNIKTSFMNIENLINLHKKLN